ncbi:MAG: ABC transporter permease, partial [Cyclobacteriaceae bacterium]|nr:ABC transporter permease [Cyclobacteriaceae bacterium]
SEITQATKFFFQPNYEVNISIGDNMYSEGSILYYDSSFFNMFEYSFDKYLPSNLHSPNSIILTKSKASNYFGKTDILGEEIKLNNGRGTIILKVVGVIDDLPKNQHLQFNLLISGATLPHWNIPSPAFNVYYKTKNILNEDEAQQLATSILSQHFDQDSYKWNISRLDNLLFDYNYIFDFSYKENKLYLYVLSITGLVVLLLTFVNTVNFNIGQSYLRVKELTIRKYLGATKKTFTLYNIAEEIFFYLTSTLIALLLVYITLYTTSTNILHKLNFSLNLFLSNTYIFLSTSLILGVFSGIIKSINIPFSHAVIISRKTSMRKSDFFRQFLIFIQVSISLCFFILFFIVNKQIQHINEQGSGLSINNTITMYRSVGIEQGEWINYKNKINNYGSVATSQFNILENMAKDFIKFKNNENIATYVNKVNQEFIPVLGMNILEGRNFSGNPSDSLSVILNSSAVASLGKTTKEILGENIYFSRNNNPFTVIGIVDDFHFQSYQYSIAPIALFNISENTYDRVIYLKNESTSLPVLLEQLKTQWKSQILSAPFNYHFLKQNFSNINQSETDFKSKIMLLSIISIILMSIGLIAFLNSNTEHYTKEIMIRKLCGATFVDLIISLQKKFYIAFVTSSIISSFMAYILINKWLDNFVYKIELNMFWFFIPALVISAITLVIIIQKTILINTNISLRGNKLN